MESDSHSRGRQYWDSRLNSSMKLLWCIWIHESHTQICTIRLSNGPLSVMGSLIQLIVATAALAQHALSIYLHRDIFLCKSNIDERTADWPSIYLAYDIIIFDFGLMRRVLGTEECVANYLDGGYMRSLWCLQQCGALLLAIMCLLFFTRSVWLLWPALLIQSSYSLGLSVLTMATAPKLLDALSGIVETDLAARFILYFSGFSFNWIFTFVLWHHYWFLEKKWKIECRDRQEEREERQV